MKYYAHKEMTKTSKKVRSRSALTIMELVLAVAMITIIFAVLVPQFSILRNSWDLKQGTSEALQNGRVLTDHISRNLSKAVRITDISESSDTDGYIEFEDNDGNTMRYDIAANNYVEYGVVGDLSDLAGPVSSLTFTCYDACDLDTALSPVSDVNIIRVVKVQATIINSASMGNDEIFTDWAYLRVNTQSDVSWENQDIGNVAAAGDAACSDCDWTIDASGNDIWNNTDEFHYVYQALSGDGQIIARVVNVENTNSWAKAGVMIRETLDGNSKHAMMVVTPGNGTAFQRRTLTGGSSTHTAGSAVTAPYWVKLTRSGDTFTGYESADGSTWTQVGNDSITMATDVYIGLCVTSHNDGTVCTAEIDNVSFNTITYETFNEAKVSTNDTSITISTPSTNEGDLLIAAVATDGDTSASLAPPGGEGWTEIYINDYIGEVTLGAWWKLADASESASHQFTWTGGQQAYGWMMHFTGHNQSDPINVWASAGQSSSTPTSPAVTTTVNNAMILRLGAFDDDDVTTTPEPGNPGLSGHTAITMDESGTASAGQVTYEGFQDTQRGSGTTSITISKPTGTSEGDLLIAAVVTDGDTSSSLSPPGGQGWAGVVYDQWSFVTLGSWMKQASASEPSSHTFTWSGSQEAYGWIMRFTGHNPASPIDVYAVDGGSSSTPDCPSVTTTVANTMILRIGGFDDDSIWTGAGNTGLSGHTGITMEQSSNGNGTCSGGAGYVQQVSIGASGIEDFGLQSNEVYRTMTIAIAPAPAAGGTVSGGAGYVLQSSSGDSGTSTFTLGLSNEAQMLTIAIAPENESGGCCGEQIRP